jgi:hypothetical protein
VDPTTLSGIERLPEAAARHDATKVDRLEHELVALRRA